MGKLIIRNNGVETQLVNGVDFTTLSGVTDTYVIGINPVTESFEQLNPDGTIINYESSGGGGGSFTGGTVSGETFFPNGLSATTISGGTISGDGSLIEGVVGLTYGDLGFVITSPPPTIINQNVVLPYNTTVKYTGTLQINVGYTLVVPDGTTLTINP